MDYLQVRVNFANIEIIQLESGIPLDILNPLEKLTLVV